MERIGISITENGVSGFKLLRAAYKQGTSLINLMEQIIS
jgi:hypothetical protein